MGAVVNGSLQFYSRSNTEGDIRRDKWNNLLTALVAYADELTIITKLRRELKAVLEESTVRSFDLVRVNSFEYFSSRALGANNKLFKSKMMCRAAKLCLHKTLVRSAVIGLWITTKQMEEKLVIWDVYYGQF
ncbi:hypothetical protein QE152_g34776 [Popillia japonica]|uniref:Uncharacterized protein n=1 Tax=Popillia japonica TaxID=7064 RepID=A0AAW1ISQ1_POPJA